MYNNIKINESQKKDNQQSVLKIIVSTYNDLTQCAQDDPAEEFKEIIHNSVTGGQIDSSLHGIIYTEGSLNKIYNDLSSVYKEKAIPIEEINNYFNVRQKTFTDYIFCCCKQRNIEPEFIKIIYRGNNLVTMQDGEFTTILSLDEALDEIRSRLF